MKPEFWEDEVIGSISRDARLLFIATFNLADDSGVLRWSPEYLKAAVFMYDRDLDTDLVGFLMDELTGKRLVMQYTVESTGQRLGQVVNFRKHQVINRPQPSKFPRPPWEASSSVNDSLNDSLILPGLFTAGREQGTGKGTGKGVNALKRSTPFPESFEISSEDIQKLKEKTALDIDWSREFEKFRDYHQAKGSKFVDWKAAWRNWSTKAVEYAQEKLTPTGKPAGGQPWF